MRRFLSLLLICIGCWAAGPATTRGGGVFQTLDVYVDADGRALAAYQIDIHARNPDVSIVGIEGGDAAAFRSAPYYDPAALNRRHVIIAAFSTDADLPSGTLRVARLHLFNANGQPTVFDVHLVVAGTTGGTPIAAKAYVRQGEVQ